MLALIVLPLSITARQQRQIPIVVEAHPVSATLKSNESLFLRISIHNGLSNDIHFSTFSLTPNDWNGEVTNISLVDIYRDVAQPMNLFLSRPKIGPEPKFIAGVGSYAIKPKESLSIVVDMRKWQIQEGWLPGKYKITVRADNIYVDRYTSASVMSNPVEVVLR
jgi:hypothetical protein